jgi:hypothetical protein
MKKPATEGLPELIRGVAPLTDRAPDPVTKEAELSRCRQEPQVLEVRWIGIWWLTVIRIHVIVVIKIGEIYLNEINDSVPLRRLQFGRDGSEAVKSYLNCSVHSRVSGGAAVQPQ